MSVVLTEVTIQSERRLWCPSISSGGG